jgi:predicted DCC family thiol-disulfide oxidoreductase YuxK
MPNLKSLLAQLKRIDKLTSPRTIFSVDLRALALFRAGLGVLLMLDAIMRWPDIRAFVSDAGVLPTAPYVQEFANRLHISLHMASGTEGWQMLLHALAFLAGAAVLVGWRTRWAVAVSWVLVVSVQNRNPMVLNGGDVLLRCLVFWAMFLPMAARWSVDAALATDAPTKRLGEDPAADASANLWFGGGSIALVLQIVLIYVATAFLKSGKEWWPEGSASYYALALDQFTTSFGVWMSQWHTLLWISTYAVFFLEASSGALLLCPFYFPIVRTLTVLALMVLHFNFDLTMRLGLFPWVDIVGLAALLPGALFDALAARAAKPERLGLVIYFDADCGFCKKMVYIIRELLLLPQTRIEQAQDTPKIAELLAEEHSWIVVTADGEQHLRWRAFVAVLEASPYVGWLARRLPLRKLSGPGDVVYRLVARNRGRLGKLTKRYLPWRDMGDLRQSLPGTLLALFFAGYVALWNAKTIPQFHVDIVAPWSKIASVLRLDQKWNMFAPYPLKDDGWYVIDGTLKDGTRIDVFKDGDQPVSWEKPELVAWTYTNARWRKYMMNIWQKSKKAHRLYYGKYLCRTFNEDRPDSRRLQRFDIVFMKERTMPPGEPTSVQKVTIWQHDCFKTASSSSSSSAIPSSVVTPPAVTPAPASPPSTATDAATAPAVDAAPSTAPTQESGGDAQDADGT